MSFIVSELPALCYFGEKMCPLKANPIMWLSTNYQREMFTRNCRRPLTMVSKMKKK